jgi:hypothetical protein
MPDVTLRCRYKGCAATVAVPIQGGTRFTYDNPRGWAIQQMGDLGHRGWGVCPEHRSVRLSYPNGDALSVEVTIEQGHALFTATDKTGLKMVAASAPSNTGALQPWRNEQCSESAMALIAEAYGIAVVEPRYDGR